MPAYVGVVDKGRMAFEIVWYDNGDNHRSDGPARIIKP